MIGLWGRAPRAAVAAWLMSGACLLGAATAHAATTGDAKRGEAVHEVCLQCHDTSVMSQEEYNLAVADLVAFLNARFYHF